METVNISSLLIGVGLFLTGFGSGALTSYYFYEYQGDENEHLRNAQEVLD